MFKKKEFKKQESKISIGYLKSLYILDLIILRLNRGLTLDSTLESIKQLNFKNISETFGMIESESPISLSEFDDESHFFIAILEILRQSKVFDPYQICDILAFLKNTLHHKVYYGEPFTHLFDSYTHPEQYAKTFITQITK